MLTRCMVSVAGPRTSIVRTLAVLTLLAAPMAANAEPLRILNWNIHRGENHDRSTYTLSEQVELIASYRPHIVTLQEVYNSTQAQSIEQRLEQLTGREYYASYYGNLILSVWPLSSQKNVKMPFGAPLTMAATKLPNGKPLGIFAIHKSAYLGEQYSMRRATQTAEVVYWLTTLGTTSRLLIGDFNITTDGLEVAPYHHWYTELSALARSKGIFFGPDTTRYDPRKPQIDYAFFGKTSRWPSWMVLERYEHVFTDLSDHFPVVITFDVR